MTGTPKLKPPNTDAEWARNTQRRQEAVEHPASSRMGKWVLSTDENDNLIASFANGGSVVLAKPPQGEDPDEIATGNPFLRLNRSTGQSFGNSVRPIQWNSIVTNIGNWGIVSPPVTTIGIPVSGTYLINYKVCETQLGPQYIKAHLFINGFLFAATEDARQNNIYRTLQITEVIELNAGDLIECRAWSESTTTFGTTNDPENATSIQLVCLEAA